MLSQLSKKNIKKKISSIYSLYYSKKNLDICVEEIFRVINTFNKFGKKANDLEETVTFILNRTK